MAAYSEIAAHSAYDMFSKYKCLIGNSIFPPRFMEWEFLSECAFSTRGRKTEEDGEGEDDKEEGKYIHIQSMNKVK